MIIYLCIKYETNTLIFSKDIKWKPFLYVQTGHMDGQHELYTPPLPPPLPTPPHPHKLKMAGT